MDALEKGVCLVLFQGDGRGTSHPIAQYSKKLNKYQEKHLVTEKEGLALILALQHFDVYVSCNKTPIVVYTDHNPI